MEQVTVLDGTMIYVTAKLVIKNFVQIMPGAGQGRRFCPTLSWWETLP